jgi:integrase
MTILSTPGMQMPDRYSNGMVTPVSWEDFKKDFLELYVPPMKAKVTCTQMRFALRCLEEIGLKSVQDLTPSLIARLVASRPEKNSPNSTRGLLLYVQAACNYAERSGFLRISPFRIRPISSFVRQTPARGKKHASREEISTVLELMRQRAQADGWAGWKAKRLYAMTATLAYTGMRAGECIFLQVCDISIEHGVILIVSRAAHKTKTIAAAAPIPMPPKLIPIIEEWLKHRMSRPPGYDIDSEDCPWVFPTMRRFVRAPWMYGGPGSCPRDRMRAVAAEAGVIGFGPLMLRHSMATHLLHWGAGAGIVKRILRHTTERTAQTWYTHDDIPNLKAAVANVEF